MAEILTPGGPAESIAGRWWTGRIVSCAAPAGCGCTWRVEARDAAVPGTRPHPVHGNLVWLRCPWCHLALWIAEGAEGAQGAQRAPSPETESTVADDAARAA